MSSGRPGCGLGSLLSMSCRGRAEAFARRLHSRLQSLRREPTPQDDDWPVASNSSDSDLFFDFDVESPGSPVEDRELTFVVNAPRATDAGAGTSPGSDSSDGVFFDLDGTQPCSYECHTESEDSDQMVSSVTSKLCNGHPKTGDYIHTDTSESTQIDALSPSDNQQNHISYTDIQSVINPPAKNDFDLTNNASNTLKENNKYNDLLSSSKVLKCTLLDTPIAAESPENVDQEFSPLDTQQESNSTTKLEDSSPPNEEVQNSAIEPQESRENVLENCRDETESIGSDSENTLEPDDCHQQSNVYVNDELTNDVACLCVDDSNQGELSEDSFYSSFNRASDLLIECVVPLSFEQVEEASCDSEEGLIPVEERLERCSSPIPVIVANEELSETKLHVFDDEEDDDPSSRRVRRCSSLKTGKTPPGTPGRKKIVRFADVLGLDLAAVRTFLDEVPRVPRSAYEDLRDADLSLGCSPTTTYIKAPTRCLVPLFQQPGGQPDFMDRIRERQLCLESAVVSDAVTLSVEGFIRVRNLDFHKSVHVRYSLDGWKSFADLQATYVPNSCDGFSDKFTFLLFAHTLTVGQRLEFALRFQCKGSQFWDSNSGANYAFQCMPPATSTPYLALPSPEERWASFY